MSGLDAIAVTVEGAGSDVSNALPVLHEIRHALLRLGDSGEPTTIDLKAIPFGPGDAAKLFAALGEGEVSATIDALGESRVNETAYPGVWIVRHFGPGGDELTTHIEVTRMPSVLSTPEGDIAESAQRLAADLQTNPNETA